MSQLEDAFLLAMLRDLANRTTSPYTRDRCVTVTDSPYRNDLRLEEIPNDLHTAVSDWCYRHRALAKRLVCEPESQERIEVLEYEWVFSADGSIRVYLERSVRSSAEVPHGADFTAPSRVVL